MSTLPARFWAKVTKTETCWIWTGGLNEPGGYGRVYVGKAGGRQVDYAHRVAYRDAFGSIPDGIQIDHTCSNRQCVRPDHLRLATPKQNGEHRRGAQSNSKTGVRGVVKRGNVYRAVIMHNRQYINLGHFPSIEEASAAHTAAAERLFTHHIDHRRAAA